MQNCIPTFPTYCSTDILLGINLKRQRNRLEALEEEHYFSFSISIKSYIQKKISLKIRDIAHTCYQAHIQWNLEFSDNYTWL